MRYGFSQPSLGITEAIAGLSFSSSVSPGETSVNPTDSFGLHIWAQTLCGAEVPWTSDA